MIISGMMQRKRDLCDQNKLEDSTELSLGPSKSSSSSSESDGRSSTKKRKQVIISLDHQEEMKEKKGNDGRLAMASHVELQLGHGRHPLPPGWEQCLDLASGSMYYLNRKTLKKSWVRPKEDHQPLNLELNISSTPSALEQTGKSTITEDLKKNVSNSTNNMIAVACVNCHLLVMLCKSSPSCPNCKFVHSLQPVMPQLPPQRKMVSVKSLETLSLLN
ncbi:hypothetical protein LUZ60_007555 [Juncus effusus]|nr:hypothetical protein LUZ60_007555 [Juncus effusus]